MLNKLVIDAGSGYIKLVYGHNFRRKLLVKNVEVIKTPRALIVDGRIKEVSSFAMLIKEYIISNKLRPLNISFVLHSSEIMTRLIKLPKMQDKNIQSSIKWELTEMYKLKLDKYYFGYEVTKDKYNERIVNVQVILVPIDLIDQYDEISRITGIKLKYIDVASKCMLRLLKEVCNDFVVIDYGFESVRLSLYSNKSIFADREFNFNEPEQNQIEKSSIRTAFFDEELFLKTFTRIVDFFLSQNSEKKLDNIFITGGGEPSSSLLNFISLNYLKPIKINDVNNQFDAFLKKGNNMLNLYSNAFGLFIRM